MAKDLGLCPSSHRRRGLAPIERGCGAVAERLTKLHYKRYEDFYARYLLISGT